MKRKTTQKPLFGLCRNLAPALRWKQCVAIVGALLILEPVSGQADDIKSFVNTCFVKNYVTTAQPKSPMRHNSGSEILQMRVFSTRMIAAAQYDGQITMSLHWGHHRVGYATFICSANGPWDVDKEVVKNLSCSQALFDRSDDCGIDFNLNANFFEQKNGSTRVRLEFTDIALEPTTDRDKATIPCGRAGWVVSATNRPLVSIELDSHYPENCENLQ